jgi:hypothetical protein
MDIPILFFNNKEIFLVQIQLILLIFGRFCQISTSLNWIKNTFVTPCNTILTEQVESTKTQVKIKEVLHKNI